MVRVHNRAAVFRLEWCCTLCQQQCRLDQLWLAFPPGEHVEGRWIHRGCLDGRVADLFGTARVVLMRGIDALQRLAESLAEEP
jgi:hypothetical protein